MVKRIYVPLPDEVTRKALVSHLIKKHNMQAMKSREQAEEKAKAAKIAADKPNTTKTGSGKGSASSSRSNSITAQSGGTKDAKSSSATEGSSQSGNGETSSILKSLGNLMGAGGTQVDTLQMSDADLERITSITEGYSGSDLNAVRFIKYDFMILTSVACYGILLAATPLDITYTIKHIFYFRK